MQLLVLFFSYIYINCMQFPNRKLLSNNKKMNKGKTHDGKGC